MLYFDNGKLGKMSAIGLGCWNFGAQWGRVSEDEAIRIIRYAIDNGIGFVDVAESYGYPDGQCEIILGKALTGGYRDKVKIVSKIGWWGRREQDVFTYRDSFVDRYAKRILGHVSNRLYHTRTVDLSERTPELLRLCGHACCGRLLTDHVDLLLCHDDRPREIDAFVDAFRTLKKEGFICNYGISTNEVSVLESFYEKSGGECAACEFDYSLVNRSAEDKLIPFCRSHGIAMLCRGVMSRGLLSGRYDLNTTFTEASRAQWNVGGVARDWYEQVMPRIDALRSAFGKGLSEAAVSFAVNNPCHPSVIVGCTSIEQVERNIKVCERIITEEEYRKLCSL